MTKEGLLVVDISHLSDISDDELKQMQQDIDVTNQYIKDGLMGFDENLNVLFDKRDDTTYTTLEERNHGGRKADTTTYKQDTTTHEYGQLEGTRIDVSKPQNHLDAR